MNHDRLVLSNGTTIMAMTCSDGVVLCADSRATTGAYVAMRDMNKITDITPDIYVCHSGSASDTQALARFVKYYTSVLTVYSNNEQKQSVAVVAQILRKMLQKNKEYLMAQMIVAGVDDNGPACYMVMQSGCALQRDFAAGGSGSTYITSYCDQFFRPGMSVEEATKFAVKAVNHATIRDGYSGGPINVVQITKDGSKRVWFKPGNQPLDHTIVKT
ncbi:Proteasome subunit beta type-6 [Tritrichomonas foetus]|uniref:Proteasome subunit beta n=1 Tax=Tritrichomonas foetus TaxID=1144522 RepID=A0A1J4JE79_9EUKA|nr:Proteasome subunit beta type-6 [Tritrichomonas foetus]|eukprot:OHS95564.1 Proteasome subunit beta type-6 [Tritrichomonas foetus]